MGSGGTSGGGPALPAGDLTFVFTDIEGSTPRWESNPSRMRVALELHDALVQGVVAGFGGVVFNHTGDGVTTVFETTDAAVQAAVDLQRALQSADWPDGDRLKVRIGVHAGHAAPTGRQYFGIPLNRTARVMDVANGDQIAVTGVVVERCPDLTLRSQGVHQLRGIGSEEIHLVVDPDMIEDRRPLRSRTTGAMRPLPSRGTPLIGRDADLAGISTALAEARLVTLVGPGGVGKTSLAIEAARDATAADGRPVVFCELGAIVETGAVAEVVAEAMGARRQPDMTLLQSLVSFVDGRPLLIVLDNCEHVLDEVRELIDATLAVAGPSVLATSRQAIGTIGVEQRWPVAPLDPAAAARELFVQRTRQRDPHFEVTEANRAAIDGICERLDGLPAAIELAAARMQLQTAEGLLDGLNDLFAAIRPTPTEQTRPLTDTIQWSYASLSDAEAALFNRLSVFPAGFSLEAAAAVSELSVVDTMDLLHALVDKSMVMPVRGGARVRFSMLQTLRAYGLDRLGVEALGVRRRHADWFVEMARAEAALLLTEKEVQVWDHLGSEWANLRAAFELLVEEDVDSAIELVLSLAWYATFAMRFELFTWADRLLEDRRVDAHPRRAALLGTGALGAYFVADDRAVDLATAALELDPTEPTGLARGALAAVYLNNLHAGDDADRITGEWLSMVDDDSGPENRLWAMAMRTFHLSLTQRPDAEDRSGALAQATWELAERSGSASAIALGRWAQGLSSAANGDLPRASEAWEAGIDVAESLGSNHLLGHLLRGLLVHWQTPAGDLDDVLRTNLSCLELAIEQHYLVGTSHLFGVAAIALSRAGEVETGAALLGAMRANGHEPRYPALPMLQAAAGDEFERMATGGRGWSVKHAGQIAVAALRSALDNGA